VVLFPLFWYLRVVQKVEYPIWVVYVTQAFMFGGGLAGISYGILSTSWDPRREGSALGWTELQVRATACAAVAGLGRAGVRQLPGTPGPLHAKHVCCCCCCCCCCCWCCAQANLPLLLNRNKDEQQGQ
jgi:hypothetical protein